MGGPDVLDLVESKGTRGTGGVWEAGSRTVTDGAAKTGIWGSSTGAAGGG